IDWTAFIPGTTPRTRMVAANTHSVAINPPRSSAHSLSSSWRMANPPCPPPSAKKRRRTIPVGACRVKPNLWPCPRRVPGPPAGCEPAGAVAAGARGADGEEVGSARAGLRQPGLEFVFAQRVDQFAAVEPDEVLPDRPDHTGPDTGQTAAAQRLDVQ